MKTLHALRLKTLALGLGGALLFRWAGMPLPFLFGPLAACLAAALAGQDLKGPGAVSAGARTILGVAAGAAITPEVVGMLPSMAVSVALVPVFVALIGLIGMPFFRRLGYDAPTAWYAAMPGGFQDMVVFGQEAGADVRALSLIQATRVLFIVTLAPVLIVHLYGRGLDNPVGEPFVSLPAGELALMAAAALGGWKLAARAGLFGASILGPLIATVILAQCGLLHHRPPREAILAAQFFIGLGIGVHYVGVTLAEIRRYVASGALYVGILAILSALFTEVVSLAGLAPPVDAFLAFAPGGQSEMTVLAIVTGADLGFVIVHHMVRMVTVILGAPVAARWLMPPRGDP
ncbi:AbrB family transcriptional regulator [Mangrovicoccus algicola]|uniref:AbrB family transcriptional regulator n=1 Tax=Mangrovicoccus algicola TaxID=2771008 RepID=A0A8J6YVW4_9RHOB|nr:AbrB family transcriptional regulator [Mangrovicoccus algicola]MBE3636741.1 AbrB family transcriptional regulator [Mangrovicoccus algicola]